MGEIADMMLEGTLCAMCGVFIGTDSGIPTYCSEECAKDAGDSNGYIEDNSEDEAKLAKVGWKPAKKNGYLIAKEGK